MSSQKTNNNDSCRDLSGRRLSTIKEAKKYVILCYFSSPFNPTSITFGRLAEYLESEPERLAAKAEAQKAKLEALERKLGIEPSSSNLPEVGSGASDTLPALAGKKHRFDDTEYIEQSRELTENVKSAVSAGTIAPRFSPFPEISCISNSALEKEEKAKIVASCRLCSCCLYDKDNDLIRDRQCR
jgi:hypothetical protein